MSKAKSDTGRSRKILTDYAPAPSSHDWLKIDSRANRANAAARVAAAQESRPSRFGVGQSNDPLVVPGLEGAVETEEEAFGAWGFV